VTGDARPRIIPPVVGYDDEYFWEGVAQGKLLIQRCAECGALRHPPVPMCGECGSVEWDTQAASGRGSVYTWILSHHPTEPDATPRIVALVELEEGIRLVSNLVGAELADVHNGMLVEVTYVDYDGVVLPQFRPAGTPSTEARA
jgi:uncharacterized OB-fold protein